MCVCRGQNRLCLPQEQKAASPRTLSMEIMALMSLASRCWQLNTDPRSDIHPNSPRALCTALESCCVKNMIWYLQKNICKWRRLAVRNGPSQGARSCSTVFGRRNQQGQMSGRCMVWFTFSNSQHVRFTFFKSVGKTQASCSFAHRSEMLKNSDDSDCMKT